MGDAADDRQILVPWDGRETLTIREAAKIAKKSEGTIRNWCLEYGIGRMIGGGWQVSRVALHMFLDGATLALAAYRRGDRGSDLVVPYFERTGLRSPRTN